MVRPSSAAKDSETAGEPNPLLLGISPVSNPGNWQPLQNWGTVLASGPTQSLLVARH